MLIEISEDNARNIIKAFEVASYNGLRPIDDELAKKLLTLYPSLLKYNNYRIAFWKHLNL